MQFTLNITDWQAIAPGLALADEWLWWANQSPARVDHTQPLAKCSLLPMMTARRLSSGSRLAVECGLAILSRQSVDAIVYTSRHGELERNYRILQALATEQSLSPTDFAMSVHNSAVGNLTIAARKPLVSSSLSAGVETFQQGLLEVLALHQAGYSRVLMVDFDGVIPEFYHPYMTSDMPKYPFAVALLIEPGDILRCATRKGQRPEPEVPQSLQFLHHWLGSHASFVVTGGRFDWQWNR
ncbi:beta-ketoacyl synthase chain length factor [Yersinia nurmii]|nr:beta-ketoacyl synthase chain length factor [Yersinia nurmii]MDN0086169.1 beta-ketoacyl synthase chain length factor [Yersinia nurmii]